MTHIEKTISEIASKELFIDDLATSDSGDDFKELAVWQIKAALEAAYAAGANAK